MCEVLEGINGLANECKIISEEIGLANVVTQSVSKGEIKRAICEKDKEEKRQDMENSKKVGDRLTDNPTDNSYLSVMPLHLSRVWIRYRAKMCKGVKYNNKRLYKDLQCKFCTSGEEETQEHLEVWYRVWEEGVEDVCEKWPSEVLEQNGEEDVMEENTGQKGGGEE